MSVLEWSPSERNECETRRETSVKRTAAWILLACSLLTFAATRHYPHVHDDHDFRGPGSLVADARADIGTLWRADVFGSYDQPSGHSGFWRPLVLLSFAGEHSLTEGRPIPFAWLGHVITILLHGLATLALWYLLLALGLAWPAAFVVGAVFATHPIHVESVAWISGRTDILPALLAWTGTALLLEARSRKTLILAGLALLAAPLAKESGVLLVGLAAPLALVRRAVGGPGLGCPDAGSTGVRAPAPVELRLRARSGSLHRSGEHGHPLADVALDSPRPAAPGLVAGSRDSAASRVRRAGLE